MLYRGMYKESLLAKKDIKLRTVLQKEFRQNANFEYLQNRFIKTFRVKLSTTEDELKKPSNCIFIEKCNGGELMEAFACLYRLRWVKYKKSDFDYVLCPDTDMRDDIYKPKDEAQKKRFAKIDDFMSSLEDIPGREKSDILSGKPTSYSKLPSRLRESMRDALSVIIDSQKYPSDVERPDINDLSKAKIVISPRKTVAGDNIKEYWFDVESNIGNFGFRWNDSMSKGNASSKKEDIEFSYEVESNEKFSKIKMIEDNNLGLWGFVWL